MVLHTTPLSLVFYMMPQRNVLRLTSSKEVSSTRTSVLTSVCWLAHTCMCLLWEIFLYFLCSFYIGYGQRPTLQCPDVGLAIEVEEKPLRGGARGKYLRMLWLLMTHERTMYPFLQTVVCTSIAFM